VWDDRRSSSRLGMRYEWKEGACWLYSLFVGLVQRELSCSASFLRLLVIHPLSSLFFSIRLLLIAEHGTAGLGVEELVSDSVSVYRPMHLCPSMLLPCLTISIDSPLDSPLHGAVCDSQRGDEVENLVP
jgi:hypothetical protein